MAQKQEMQYVHENDNEEMNYGICNESRQY